MKEKEFKNVRWGDIYYCDLGVTNGSVQSGMRPVLVVQTNRLNESSPTVVVAAITAVKKKTAMNTHIELNTDCGLKEPSMVMLEQLRTVDKIKLRHNRITLLESILLGRSVFFSRYLNLFIRLFVMIVSQQAGDAFL